MEEFLEVLEQIAAFLESLAAIFSDFASAVNSVDGLVEGFTVFMQTLEEILATALTLLETVSATLATAWWVVLLVVGIVTAVLPVVVVAVTEIGKYLLTAVPVYTLAKKTKSSYAGLAWIPFFQDLFCLYLMREIADRPDFQLWGKLRIRKGIILFWVYIGVYFLGPTLITAWLAAVNSIPMFGQIVGAFSSFLYLLPLIICAVIEYVYLRDVINRFCENEKTNRVHAFAVTFIDAILLVFPFGLIKSIYLFFLMWKKPRYPSDRTPAVEIQEQTV